MSTMSFQVQRGKKKDVKELFALVFASQLFQKKKFEKQKLNERKFKRESYKTLRKWISDSDKAYFIATNQNREVVGFILCMIDNEVTKHASITDLFVGPKVRLNGVGSLLLEKAFTWLRDKKIKNVIIPVHKKNLPARNLYKKHGFLLKRDNYLLLQKKM